MVTLDGYTQAQELPQEIPQELPLIPQDLAQELPLISQELPPEIPQPLPQETSEALRLLYACGYACASCRRVR